MRKEMRQLYEAQNHKSRYRFTGTVDAISTVAPGARYIRALCLLDVTHDGEAVASHLWVPAPRGAIERDARIEFCAWVVEYSRKSGSRDYTLSGLRNVRVLAEEKQMTERNTKVLKSFVSRIIGTRCWGQEEDGGTIQDIAEQLGIIKPFEVTQQHLDSGFIDENQIDVGDTAFKFTDWFNAESTRPKIICLCGSTRFYQQFQEANYRETMAGNIVLSVGFYPHSVMEMHDEAHGCTPEQKTALDELHKRKIDLADEVFVLNVGGYVGDSTKSEIAYANSHDKPVRWLESEVKKA